MLDLFKKSLTIPAVPTFKLHYFLIKKKHIFHATGWSVTGLLDTGQVSNSKKAKLVEPYANDLLTGSL